MANPDSSASSNSPIARALGEDFDRLHPAVRRHYAEPVVDVHGTMDTIYVGRAIKPLALISYRLFGAPVPYDGTNVAMSLRNSIDASGAMHWVRKFCTTPEAVIFVSRSVCSGDHKLIEYTKYGLGVESRLTVDDEGSLVYEMDRNVIRLPLLGLIVRLPTWLSPFGGGITREIGESLDSFRVEFEMVHPIFGRTVSYRGSCRFAGPEDP